MIEVILNNKSYKTKLVHLMDEKDINVLFLFDKDLTKKQIISIMVIVDFKVITTSIARSELFFHELKFFDHDNINNYFLTTSYNNKKSFQIKNIDKNIYISRVEAYTLESLFRKLKHGYHVNYIINEEFFSIKEICSILYTHKLLKINFQNNSYGEIEKPNFNLILESFNTVCDLKNSNFAEINTLLESMQVDLQNTNLFMSKYIRKEKLEFINYIDKQNKKNDFIVISTKYAVTVITNMIKKINHEIIKINNADLTTNSYHEADLEFAKKKAYDEKQTEIKEKIKFITYNNQEHGYKFLFIIFHILLNSNLDGCKVSIFHFRKYLKNKRYFIKKLKSAENYFQNHLNINSYYDLFQKSIADTPTHYFLIKKEDRNNY